VSLKKGSGPKTIPVTLTITGQGSTDKVIISYHNRKSSEVEARLNGGPAVKMASVIPFIVESWDLGWDLTEEDVLAMEDEFPGMVVGVIEGFWKARRKQVEGN
jgi:hypothetical protein